MNAFHNRIFQIFEAATQEGLTEQGARAHLQDLATHLEHWSTAMNCALEGDEEGCYQSIKAAFAHANKVERRKKLPALKKGQPKVVRYHEYSKMWKKRAGA